MREANNRIRLSVCGQVIKTAGFVSAQSRIGRVIGPGVGGVPDEADVVLGRCRQLAHHWQLEPDIPAEF
jgi:hypothetical protein